jgi:hypothetical protein
MPIVAVPHATAGTGDRSVCSGGSFSPMTAIGSILKSCEIS